MIESKENDEVTLKELIQKTKSLFKYLLSKWYIIILVGLIGTSLGFIYALKSKAKYTASLSFALEDEGSKSVGIGGALASQFGLDIAGNGASGMFSGGNLISLFKSRRMVEQTLLTPVVYKDTIISLAEMYIINNELRKDWDIESKLKNIQFKPSIERENYSREQDSILGSIYESLVGGSLFVDQKDKKVSIISIETTSENELFSKYFTEALAEIVSNFYIETKSKKARLNLDILQKQTDSIQGELFGSIHGVAVANDNTFNLNPALNVHLTPSVKHQVGVQANTAILTELVKQLELAKVTLRKETPLIQIIDRPILPLKMEKYGKLKGILLGGFLSCFLTCIYLLSIRFFKRISK